MKKIQRGSSGVVWGMNLSFICLIEILFVVPFNWAIWGLERPLDVNRLQKVDAQKILGEHMV